MFESVSDHTNLTHERNQVQHFGQSLGFSQNCVRSEINTTLSHSTAKDIYYNSDETSTILELQSPSGTTVNICETPVSKPSKDDKKKVRKCTICSFIYTKVESFRLHENMVHRTKPPYKCLMCEYKSPTSNSINNHILYHTQDKPYFCPKCADKCFAHRSGLNGHMRKIHRDFYKTLLVKNKSFSNPININVYQCEKCTFIYTKPESLKLHLYVHNRNPPYQCALCHYKDYNTKSLSKYNQHILTHTKDKPQCCPFCSFRGTSGGHLQIHLNTKHPDTVFKCQHCAYASNRFKLFNAHKNKAHRQFEVPPIYKCEQCVFIYTKPESFKLHLLVHSSKPPFNCTVCRYSTTYPHAFSDHLLIHTKDLPYVCRYCKMSFSCLSTLRKHEKTQFHMRSVNGENEVTCSQMEINI